MSTSSREKCEFSLPSPFLHRRQRTLSSSERAKEQQLQKGTIREFCRDKGHGFVIPELGGEALFLHISDIDGEFVPQEGDEVTYKTVLIPPKNEKLQAVHARITHLKEGTVHQRWDGGEEKR